MQMERYRAERTGFARATGFDMSRFVPFIAAGSLLPSMGCGTLMFTWQMVVTGEEPFHPAIFILWAMTAAVVGGMIGLVLYRRSKQAEWRRGLEDVARELDRRARRVRRRAGDAKPNVVAPIIGATKMDQLKSDIAAVDVDLSDAVLDDIAETCKRFPMPL